jgi:diguanylate cyclase (GGDEF)-like protein
VKARFKTPASILCVPLRFKGTTLGVIEVTDRHDGRSFTEEDLGILGALADYAAIAIENAKNFQRVEELTITDDLTGLYNSRHLHQLLDFEIIRSKRHRLEFSLVFLDLDHFKRVNDRYGHLIGSRLLKEVAAAISDSLRKLDVATRYGGDEFVILLPQTSKEEAFNVAGRIRERLERSEFLHAEGLSVRITASFGVACFPTDASHKEDIIRLADQAMYRVKGTTRNDVAMA